MTIRTGYRAQKTSVEGTRPRHRQSAGQEFAMRKALVYAGDGAGARSVASTIKSLKRALPNIMVRTRLADM